MKLAAAVAAALDERAQLGTTGLAQGRTVAADAHWSVEDVVCTCRPDDRPFEEQHAGAAIAIVVAGTFQYRTTTGRALMTPGSLLLGNHGHCFRCSHEHAAGDRCVSFHYAPDYFAALAADAGLTRPDAPFEMPRMPLVRPLAPLVARARTALALGATTDWSGLATDLAVGVLRLMGAGQRAVQRTLPVHERRVTELVREIDERPGEPHTLDGLASAAGLSLFHFSRIFQDVTGWSPHQYVMRMRLQHAVSRLATPAKVLDVALDSGFGDVSNFNHAFKREFGMSPRAWRLAALAAR